MSSFTHPYARAFLEAAPAGYDIAAFLIEDSERARELRR